MSRQFRQHYTLAQARQLLPQLRLWLGELAELSAGERKTEARISKLMANSDDVGGRTVNQSLRNLVRMKEILLEFHRREIQLKDVDRGLVDFPALREGREVFLCWEQHEDDVAHWHDLDAGFDGREPL